MTAPVYLEVWKLPVSPTAKLLAVRIEAYQGLVSGWCFASNATLGAEVGVRGDASVRHALAELRAVGVLVEEVRPGRVTRRRIVSPTPVRTDPGPPEPGSASTSHPGPPEPGTPVRTDPRRGKEEGAEEGSLIGGARRPPLRRAHARADASPPGLASHQSISPRPAAAY
jgi:hypothetical protein